MNASDSRSETGHRAGQKTSALPSIPQSSSGALPSIEDGALPDTAHRPEFYDIGSDTDISSHEFQSVESSDESNYRPASRGHASPNPSSQSRFRSESSDESDYRPVSRGFASPGPSSRSRSSRRDYSPGSATDGSGVVSPSHSSRSRSE